MHTRSQVYFEDASSMDQLDDGSIALVVTSPPYPMIEMWDEVFADWDGSIGNALARGDTDEAFRLMHGCLTQVWQECYRVLQSGGIMCINVGDATRSENGAFRLYHNHARIVESCVEIGFHPMPGILWRKPTNKPTKFMGSGMLAPNAYVTLEHEHILIFRKGNKRSVHPENRERRYESAFFWEERNRWFSDVWVDLNGISQKLDASADGLRDRSGAFPLALPLRLIHMFSLYGDTILDPFWGTGTTALAASLLKRNAIGYELDNTLWSGYLAQARELPQQSTRHNTRRLERHGSFVDSYEGDLSYQNTWYDLPVVTRQETAIRLYDVGDVAQQGDNAPLEFSYQPFRS